MGGVTLTLHRLRLQVPFLSSSPPPCPSDCPGGVRVFTHTVWQGLNEPSRD